MITIDSENVILLELVKASLFDLTPSIPDDANWEKIFELAKLQCVVPLVSACVPSEYRNSWLELCNQRKVLFIQMMYEQNLLVKLLNENNIPFVILKGTSAAIYYPKPALRTFGDIDFFISESNFESAKTLLEHNGYQFIKNNRRESIFIKNGISFELHIKFSSKHYNDIEPVLLNGLNNAIVYKIGDQSFPGLPTYENGLILLGHIMQHLKALGIGLRQIIDWMMFVNKELDDSAWENHFKALARNAGLEKLAITVTYLCKKWLGLTKDITWCDTADESIVDQLLIRILNDGNFGCDRAPYENFKQSVKNEGLFKHLQHYGLDNWRLARKHKILRPFAWLYQICRYIGIGFAWLFADKKVFENDKQLMSLDELWKRLE